MYYSLAGRNTQHVLYLPEHLDLDLVVNSHHDEAAWFVSSIFLRRVLDRREPDAHVQLHSKILKRMMGDRVYRPVLDALMNAGVVECDGKWTRHEKAKGYRLTPEFRAQRHRRLPLNPASKLATRLTQWKEERSLEVHLPVHRHLQRQFDHLEIVPPGPELHLDPATAQQVSMILDQEWYMVPCQYGRVHTNLTSLDSRLRPYLRVCGRPLANLDIRNSQPLLAGLLVLMYLTNGHQSLPALNGVQLELPEVPPSSSPSPHTLSGAETNSNQLSTLGLPPDVTEYITLTQNGELYDTLMERWGIPPDRRGEFKGEFFGQVMFCKSHERYEHGRRFAQEFPTVTEAFVALKRKDYTQAAKLLQRVESSLMIHRVARRVMDELPDAPVYTIHDSVLTLPEHAGPITAIVRQEYAKVGLYPTIKYEAYQDHARTISC